MNEQTTPKRDKLPSWKTPAAIAMIFLWVTTAFFLWLPSQLDKEEQITEPDWSVQVYTRENPLREGGDVTLQVFVFDKETKDPVRGADIDASFDFRDDPIILHYVENGLYENVSRISENEVLSGTVTIRMQGAEQTRTFEFPVEPFADEWENISAFYMEKTEAVSQ
ncbi:hypothetical protein JSY36_17595 [Bacillus sp. H-16]|uniref:hypothetical protein n=1 Tax=Alteribacter salitolerans TaxID=2912333 RepID=UPI001966A6B1|nr:hypothetical protein [Alteribacter salitolerans]MBM7097551.1 hypothetical protein [Alteribacter salitolerans]